MTDNKWERREFLSRIVKVIALSAGVSEGLVRRLLAEKSGFTADGSEDYSPLQRSSNTQIKALKTIIENDPRIFENEYGRITPVEKGYFDPQNSGRLMTLCRIAWFKPGGIVDTCNVVYNSGAGSGSKMCKTNNCRGEKCSDFFGCNDANICPGQECPIMSFCTTNVQAIDGAFYRRLKSDPYVQYLLKRFNAVDTDALAAQVNALLRQAP